MNDGVTPLTWDNFGGNEPNNKVNADFPEGEDLVALVLTAGASYGSNFVTQFTYKSLTLRVNFSIRQI